MSRRNARKPLAIATVVAVAATAMLGGVTVALASHGGTGNILTSSNGAKTIKFSDGRALTSTETIIDAAWAPDGSRALFVNPAGAIMTVRYNDGPDVWPIADPEPGVQRRQPTWRGSASAVLWSERASTSVPFALKLTTSSFGGFIDTISPSDGMHYTHPDGGPGSVVVFQRQGDSGGTPTGTPEVWLYDPSAGSTPQTRIRLITSNSGNPAIAPDGSKVAFVRSDGTRSQIWVSDLNGHSVLQATNSTTAKDNPTWSPDGKTIAFNNGGNTVATAPADGSAPGGAPVANLDGVPTYQAANTNHVIRLAGSSRFGTAVAISQQRWATAGDLSDDRAAAKAVVLTRSDTFAEALSGSALAAAKEGPLLMTQTDHLNSETHAEIVRVLPRPSTVYILGGRGAISHEVINIIYIEGFNVERLAGNDRFETSVAIAQEITPQPDLVLAATGLNFPDALAAGVAAGSYNVPGTGLTAVVVLTADERLPAATKSYLDAATTDPDALVFGIGRQATTAVTPYNPLPLIGADRYETALLTAQVFFGGERIAGLATGTNWPDALAGGALLATVNGPMLLTPSTSNALNADTAFHLDVTSGSIDVGLIFGGPTVVRVPTANEVGKWISGPAGFETSNTARPGLLGATGESAGRTQAAKASPETRRSPAQLKAAVKAITSAER